MGNTVTGSTRKIKRVEACGYTRAQCAHPKLHGKAYCQTHGCPHCGGQKSSNATHCDAGHAIPLREHNVNQPVEKDRLKKPAVRPRPVNNVAVNNVQKMARPAPLPMMGNMMGRPAGG
eukprot:NODE_656_length_760_cov_116.621660_g591_i0.p2 GENE.NODE_656_length_760_cov_116.621660_g591_i0~~NODE_656_length_760_cov_116.621660_g591_i0.p2  ORF type:complete len:128 (+),score=38.55 NODE_656_length_760_cov_116.621660_g591_i0:31-384(+)